MKAKPRQSGLTLTEMVVVVAAVALLTGLGLPAIRTLFNSMATSGGTRAMISAALASARAIAAKEQRYAGIRFQEDLAGNQYMIFIVNDPNLYDSSGFRVVYGFRTVEGIQPIKLPESIGVMDLRLGSTAQVINDNSLINTDSQVKDTTTFSIIFSPSGKLVIHYVQVLRKNIYDRVFNDPTSPIKPMFEDDFFIASPSYQKEASRNSFVIYDKVQFGKIDIDRRWLDYLSGLEVIYINPYTGTIIKR